MENNLFNREEREISTAVIGELVMERLKDLDVVTYVRFASVYREFKDVDTFMEELQKIQQRKVPSYESWKERGRDQMMGNAFYPDEWLDSAYDIPYEQFYQKGMRGIIFDIDNTLVPHGAPADERAVQLFERCGR